jgi:hypothetical protein
LYRPIFFSTHHLGKEEKPEEKIFPIPTYRLFTSLLAAAFSFPFVRSCLPSSSEMA